MTGSGGRAARRAAVAATALLGALVVPGPAHAEGPGLDIDHVEIADGRATVLLGADRLPGTPAPGDLAVSLGGRVVEATARPVAAGEVERTTVLAIDASNSMRGAAIEEAKAAARAFLEAAPADVRVGLLTFAGRVRDVVPPTGDREALGAAIDGIDLTGGTRLYDAVAAATELAGDDGARSVLLLSDGRDQGGGRSVDDVVGQLADDGVVVDVVALGRGTAGSDELAEIADVSGGAVANAADPVALRALFTGEAQALARQLLVRFDVPAGLSGGSQLEVSLAADGTTYSDEAFVSVPAAADKAQAPTAARSGGGPLVGSTGLLVGALAVGLALALATGVLLLGREGTPRAQRRLGDYFGERSAEARHLDLKGSAVTLARAAVPKDVQARLAHRLAGAGISLTAAGWVLLHSGIAVGAASAGLVLGGPVLMVLLLLAGIGAPFGYLRISHARRLGAFGAQLPDTLTLVANSLAAGLSVPQAMDTVVREGQEPMAGEIRRALMEQRLGIGFEEALDGVTLRMGSEDFGWVVMAMRVQREVGGNLGEVLTTVAETLREREYLRRQVRTLSAEGRLSGWILGALPVGMFCYMVVANRDYVSLLWTEQFGLLMLGGAVALLGLGAWVMSRLVKIEV